MPIPPIPRSLFARRPDWRGWIEDFPRLDPDGYVPIGKFNDAVREHLTNAPAGSLTESEAERLKTWFGRLLRPARRIARDNRLKAVIGYVATAAPVIVDFALTGGVGTAVGMATGVLGATTVAADVANGKSTARLDEIEDVFEAWLDNRQ